jgi:CBS domain-containing protein
MLTAKDIMTGEVYTVSAEMSVDELARLFAEKGVDAMPVVDSEGRLEGIVTQTDLIEQDRPLHIPTVISIFDWVLYLESEKGFREELDRISARKVGEICSRNVITCRTDTSVADIADLMVKHKAHLIPVVEKGKLVGVVARLDIIRSMGR